MKRILLLLILAAGCQKARPYEPRPAPEKEKAASTSVQKPVEPPKLPPNVDWDNPGRKPDENQIPIVFVNRAVQPEEWAALPAYWNEPPLPKKGEAPKPVRIKVPLGLDDPTPYIPPHSTPTQARWVLGRRLFFDRTLLGTKQSCADCHMPGEAFADGQKAPTGRFNTPSLVNSVYNAAQFWDGRATYLEEVVQQKPEDELAPADGPFRHVWPGVIGRLRANQSYRIQFDGAFGLLPNQTTVGQAIATYLRTLLAADSLHDKAERARQAAKAPKLEAAHYASVLDEKAMIHLGRPEGVKAVVASDLVRGHAAFHGAAGCARCHPSANGHFSDNRFHNIGVDASELEKRPGRLGRFAVAPLGERNRFLRAAFRTPTLRGLLRTGPYFHNGQEQTLKGAVLFHVTPQKADEPLNYFLDPLLADADGVHRRFEATGDLDAIVLFLRALNGEEADEFVRKPPVEAKQP